MVWRSRGDRIGTSSRAAPPTPRSHTRSCASTPATPGITPRKLLSRKRRRPASLQEPSAGTRKRPRIAGHLDTVLGPVTEGRSTHLERHGGGSRSCPRCRFYLFGDAWTASYGSFDAPTGPRGRILWLAERPARWGGSWGLGCAICAGLNHRRVAGGKSCASTPDEIPAKAPAPTGRNRRAYVGTKWARYDVRPQCLQAEHIRQHMHSDAHKRAMLAHLSPDVPVRMALQATVDDDALLAGAVPQPADWLRTWRLCMDPASWESAAAHARTEHFIARIRARSVQPRSFKSMVLCMAEVVRREKRTVLREASCVFLGFDDKNGRKLLLFKVDTPAAQPCLDAGACKFRPGYGARVGVVGCMPTGIGATLAEYERDYAERTADQVVKLIAKLCTPAGDVADQVLLDGVLRKVRGVVVDGALLKTAQVLRSGAMPNISVVLRDPSHVIRASCRDPLHDGALFGEQYERLFEGRHAVLKDFQNSSQWQDQLEASQREILQRGGSLGGDLGHTLRHMSFIQPRFESFVVPRRRYVCLLRAIPVVLASKAGDDRLAASVRQRCEAALNAMSGADCFTAGLAGDFGELCLHFLRRFDKTDHDPARTTAEVADFTSTLRRLFVQGYVVCEPSLDGGEDVQNKTLAQIALEAIEEPLVLTCPVHGESFNRHTLSPLVCFV